ncbi:MAG: DUF1501 domain-containing protein [Planctomycetota bacterium]|nr:DUF1501 domain-containing protein [Planctomycetota bacterium]
MKTFHNHAPILAPLTGLFDAAPLAVNSRRWFLQAGMGGLGALAGASMLPSLAHGAQETIPPKPNSKKSVILFWLAGGPSQIDMWDPKPEAPREIRGPYSAINTRIPGVRFCEHLPLQASIADKLSVLRAVDCRSSNHTPITFQAGNPLAQRTNDGRDGGGYPSMGAVAAKFRGANDPDLPAFVGLADTWTSDIYEAGHMGSQYAPVKGSELAGKFSLPKGIEIDRLQNREALRQRFDQLRDDLDRDETMERSARYNRQAVEMITTGKVEKAFDINQESDATRDAYGRISVGEKGLLARRLVEAGVSFVVVSGKWGYFDHHGDDVPPWGGIQKGLTPILPTVDKVLHALITDLDDRGMLDDTLVLMLGEFGRSPVMTADAGRNHWLNVMSMVMAGGGLRHGQPIGSSDSQGGVPKEGIVRPQDLAATVFRHLEIDTGAHWTSPQGRPTPIVTEGGRPIPELG